MMAKLRAKNRIATTNPPMKIPLFPVVTPTNAPTTANPTAISAAHVVLSMRAPTQPSRAGSKVSEAAIIMATASAEAMATPCTKANPISNRPSNAMITVMPANSTARPLVSIDATTESSTLAPRLRFSR